MSAEKKNKHQDPLLQMLETADKKILIELIERLSVMSPEVRRECFEYLKAHVKLSSSQKETSDGEAVLALWGELEPDLAELDEYGGGDYRMTDHVGELLYQVQQKLEKSNVPSEYRADLLHEVLPYIHSANGGMDDQLYDVAYSCCYDNEDWRRLAGDFAALKQDWPINHARRIYKRIGDNKKYLQLRALRMEYGADYHDLATFYWENGKKDKAIKIAQDGLKQGKGRMDELRRFLSDRSQETGDRKGYLQLQFEQTVDQLTFTKYQAFKKLCSKDEWRGYEQDILQCLNRAWDTEKLKIFMHRKEYDKALAILLKTRYPHNSFSSKYELLAAAKLETRFPDKILGFYQSGLGNLNRSLTRKEYARKAKRMKKVRHMYVDIMNAPAKWIRFARKVKLDNKKRPAFQEEFGKAVPGWEAL